MKGNHLVLKLLNASTTKRKQGYNIQNIVCIMHVACDDVLHEFRQISFEKKKNNLNCQFLDSLHLKLYY